MFPKDIRSREVLLSPMFIASLVAFCITTILHFSLVVVISYDSAHYYRLTSVIEGNLPWSQWDVVRGLPFPFILWAIDSVFGRTQIGLLIYQYALFLILIACFVGVYKLIVDSSFSAAYKGVFGLFALVAIFLPINVGWYHIVLTESLTTTVFMISLLVITALEGSKKKWLVYAIFFPVGASFMFQLKQPYVGAVLYPIVALLLWRLLNDIKSSESVKLLTICSLSLFMMFGVHKAWKFFLPNEGAAAVASRSSSGMLSQQIIVGLRPHDEHGLYEESQGSNCSVVYHTYGLIDRLENRVILPCKEGYLSLSEAVKFWLRFAGRYPLETVIGYLQSFYEITGLGDLTGIESPRSLFKPQNIMLALRVFTYKPDIRDGNAMYAGKLTGEIRALRRFSPPSKISDMYYSLLKPYTQRFIFGASLLTSSIIFVVLFFVSLFRRSFVENIYLKLSFVCSFCVFTQMLTHSLLGSVIDRYVAPVYPISMMGVALFVAGVIKYGSKANNHSKETFHNLRAESVSSERTSPVMKFT